MKLKSIKLTRAVAAGAMLAAMLAMPAMAQDADHPQGEKLKVAEASGRLLWRRWGEQFGADPFYNARFDREARPFTRLRPLP